MVKKIIGFIIAVVVIVFLVLGIMGSQEREEVLSISEIQATDGIPILAEPIQTHTVQSTRRYYGDVRASREAVVTARLMERIDQILVREGQYVDVDQPLVRFDTTASQASVVQARLALENARIELSRMGSLLERGAVSQQQYDMVKLNHDISEANYLTAHRTVELLAPIAGRIARIEFEDGDLTFPGDPIIEIVSSSHYDIEFRVTGQDRQLMRNGQTVQVITGSDEVFEGQITHVSLSTAPESRLFRVTARVPVVPQLSPGELASISIVLEQQDNVLAVPMEALLGEVGDYRLVKIENDLAHVIPVSIGLRGDHFIEITGGIEEGDMIATYGHSLLEDGNKVNIVRE